jgi:hypothetical protein
MSEKMLAVFRADMDDPLPIAGTEGAVGQVPDSGHTLVLCCL